MNLAAFTLYTYLAVVTSVYDGDTITVDVNLGMDTWIHNTKIRLARIDAPELTGSSRPQGIISRNYLRDKLLYQTVTLKTYKDKKGKYGRYIGEIYLDNKNINDNLVENNLAEYKEY
jgi:micrococcal nuclease